MKNKLYILFIAGLLVAFNGYCQDSARTTNDKPGTPQSLRTANNAPQSQVRLINPNTVPGQAINHGATENSQVSTARPQPSGDVIPQPPMTTADKVAIRTDSTNNNIINTRKSNITNPIRK